MYQDRIAKILQAEMPLAGNGYVQDVAKRIADEVYGHIVVTGVRSNGKRVKLETIDKGSNIPGYGEGGLRYEAYTRWWRVLRHNRKLPRKSEEGYIQVDYALAHHSGNPRTYRDAVEIEAFTKVGFDPYSFKLPDGSPMYVRAAA